MQQRVNEATIDVLIPVFNGAAWIEASIDSIRQQTHRALRMHVVDDGSDDATPTILGRLAALDPRLEVHTKTNGGIVEALNHGLSFCTSEWLARHDADDLASPHRLATQLAYLLAHDDCVAVGATARHIDAAGLPLGTFTRLRPPAQADAGWFPAKEPYLMHPFLLARRADVVAAGAYRDVPYAEDSDLYWRLRERGRLHNLDDVLGDYRVHDHSLSSTSIVNGRLMSVGSQLAALSARRRMAHAPDLAFDRARVVRLRACRGTRAMVDAASADLAPAERHAFALAVAAKLLELTSYQPYELDPDDCAFVRDAVRLHATAIAAANRRALGGQLSRASVRLFAAGRKRDAMRLLSWRTAPQFALRYAIRAGLPDSLRHRLHAAIGPTERASS